jgi:hypothetical protein
MSERLWKTLRKFADFQAEYEVSIPFTRLNVFSASLQAPDFIPTDAAAFDDLFQRRKKRPSCCRGWVNPSVLVWFRLLPRIAI